MSATAFFIAGVASRAWKLALARSPRSAGFCANTIPFGAGHQLAAVAGAGAHIEHLHAPTRRSKGGERRRIAALVGVAVGSAAVGGRNKARVIRRGLRRGAVEREGRDTGGRCDRGGDQKTRAGK